MNHFVEIRSIEIKPGQREEFHRLYIEKSVPLLQQFNFDLVAYGPSLQEENSYYVIRRYDSLPQREQMEEAFYGSDDWKLGPREGIMALLENYVDIVLELDDITVQGLRRRN